MLKKSFQQLVLRELDIHNIEDYILLYVVRL